jgi:adenylate kinase
VPDTTVIALVRERSSCLQCGGGFLLDGFPRTVAQAQALEAMLRAQGLALDAVVAFDMPIEAIVARVSGRRTCRRCHAVYHVDTHPPAKAGVCDRCAAPLEQRDDDRPDAVRVRKETYARSTAPLLAFYAERKLLVTVPAEGTPEEVFARTELALGPALAGSTRTENTATGGTASPHARAGDRGRRSHGEWRTKEPQSFEVRVLLVFVFPCPSMAVPGQWARGFATPRYCDGHRNA